MEQRFTLTDYRENITRDLYLLTEEYPKLTIDNNKWGYADEDGKIIIATQYDIAQPFVRGHAIVAKCGSYGVIDTCGNEVIPLIYDTLFYGNTNEQLIVGIDHKRGVIDLSNDNIIDIDYDSILPLMGQLYSVKRDGKYGVINHEGKSLAPVIYDSADPLFMSVVLRYGDKYGIVNHSGSQTGLIYDNIVYNDTADIKVQKGGKWGIINMDFEEIIPAIYERIWQINSSCALVKKDGEWYYYMASCGGKFIPVNEHIGDESFARLNRTYLIKRVDGELMVVLDKDFGQDILAPIEIDNYTMCLPKGTYVVLKDGKYGFICSDGKFITPCIYDMIKDTYQGAYKIVLNGKWGLANSRGEHIIEPKYDDGSILINNYAIVRLDGKMGCIGINQNSGVNIPAEYDTIGVFDNAGFAPVERDGKWGVINTHNEVVLPIIHDKLFCSGYDDSIGVEKDGVRKIMSLK